MTIREKMVLNIIQHKVDSHLVIMTRRMIKMRPANAQTPPITASKEKGTISSVLRQNRDYVQHLYSHSLNYEYLRKTNALSKSLCPYTLMRFQKYPFSVSSKTHRSIRVHTTVFAAFSTVHTKTLENAE